MKNIILNLGLILLSISATAQVLITRNTNSDINIEPSAILEIRDNKSGILVPRVAITSKTDNTTVPSPVDGLLIQSKNHKKFMFWKTNRWYKNFGLQDAEEVIKVTTNFITQQSAGTTINTFPSSMPLFTLGSNTSGWKDLGVETPIVITKVNNTVSINVEGMASINNLGSSAFQFAIGIFINNKLELVRKFYEPSAGKCSWKKFNLSGIVKDLPVPSPNNPHKIKVMAYNLPKINNLYNKITYGNISTSNCHNLNTTMAKTVLSATVNQ